MTKGEKNKIKAQEEKPEAEEGALNPEQGLKLEEGEEERKFRAFAFCLRQTGLTGLMDRSDRSVLWSSEICHNLVLYLVCGLEDICIVC